MQWSKRRLLVGWLAWPFKTGEGDPGDKQVVEARPPRFIPTGAVVEYRAGVIRYEGRLYRCVPESATVAVA